MTAVPPPPAPPGAPAQKSSGCWKWGIIGCAAALVIIICGIAAIMAVVFGAMKATDAYRGPLSLAQNDPRIIEALGAPVHAGIWVFGSVHVEGSEGSADIRFPLYGSKNSGIEHVIARKVDGKWHYDEITVLPKHGSTIDLLTAPSPPQ